MFQVAGSNEKRRCNMKAVKHGKQPMSKHQNLARYYIYAKREPVTKHDWGKIQTVGFTISTPSQQSNRCDMENEVKGPILKGQDAVRTGCSRLINIKKRSEEKNPALGWWRRTPLLYVYIRQDNTQEDREEETSHSRRRLTPRPICALHYATLVLMGTLPRRPLTTGMACTLFRSNIRNRGPYCRCCCYSHIRGLPRTNTDPGLIVKMRSSQYANIVPSRRFTTVGMTERKCKQSSLLLRNGRWPGWNPDNGRASDTTVYQSLRRTYRRNTLTLSSFVYIRTGQYSNKRWLITLVRLKKTNLCPHLMWQIARNPSTGNILIVLQRPETNGFPSPCQLLSTGTRCVLDFDDIYRHNVAAWVMENSIYVFAYWWRHWGNAQRLLQMLVDVMYYKKDESVQRSHVILRRTVLLNTGIRLEKRIETSLGTQFVYGRQYEIDENGPAPTIKLLRWL